MRLDVHVYVHTDPPCEDSLTDIRNLLREINERTKKMSAELDDLTSAVAENTTIDQSAIALIEGIAAQLSQLVANATELGELKAAITAKAADLRASSAALSAAVAANTPDAP